VDKESGQTFQELRATLLQLFQDAGYRREELLRALEDWQKDRLRLQKFDQLVLENERLRRDIRSVRGTGQAKLEDGMSSKLRDALRE
jgi:hypothetical protein